MNKPKPITVTARTAALVGAFSLIAVATSQGAFSGNLLASPLSLEGAVSLGAVQANDPGTVIAAIDSPFVDNAEPTPFAQGVLRSFVVKRSSDGLLDFYYQLVNTTATADPTFGTDQFFRLKSIAGFRNSDVLSIGQANTLTGLTGLGSYTQGASLKPGASGDYGLGTPGSVGFDFPSGANPFIPDAANIGAGQKSTFLIIHSNSSTYGAVSAAISGAATGYAVTFSTIPEPSSILFGLAMLGVTLNSRSKNRRQKSA